MQPSRLFPPPTGRTLSGRGAALSASEMVVRVPSRTWLA